MSSVEGRPIGMALPLAGPPPPVAAPCGAVEETIASMPETEPMPLSVECTATTSSGGALAALLDEARAARAELGRQPLPITNHNSQLIMKLLGG